MRVPLEATDEFSPEDTEILPNTFDAYAKMVTEALMGNGKQLQLLTHSKDLPEETNRRMNEVNIIGIEKPSKGIYSIFYYQEFDSISYRDRLCEWFESCAFEKRQSGGKRQLDSPTAKQLACAIMGEDAVKRAEKDTKCEKSDSKLLREIYKRLLDCRVNGTPLPLHFVRSALHRIYTPLGFTDKDGRFARRQYERGLSTVCAMLRRRCFDSARSANSTADRSALLDSLPSPRLDPHNSSRGYLYGRLFAVADHAEQRADDFEKKEPTNAIRLLKALSQRPRSTWTKLHSKLLPYFNRLGSEARAYQKLLGEIESLFTLEQRRDDRPLSDDFCFGYYSQLRALNPPPNEPPVDAAKTPYCYAPSNSRSELYGAMLAVAERVELLATPKEENEFILSAHDGRTQPLCFMNAFAARPLETWALLHGKMTPYLEKLGTKARFYEKLLAQLERGFDKVERLSSTPLHDEFLHGYYCNRRYLSDTIINSFVPCASAADEGTSTRDDAYAVLLALENRIERQVLDREKSDEDNRGSNAYRFINAFERNPASVWRYLRERQRPYARALRGKALLEQLEAVEQMIEQQGWDTPDTPLGGGWLNTFYRHYYLKGESI